MSEFNEDILRFFAADEDYGVDKYAKKLPKKLGGDWLDKNLFSGGKKHQKRRDTANTALEAYNAERKRLKGLTVPHRGNPQGIPVRQYTNKQIKQMTKPQRKAAKKALKNYNKKSNLTRNRVLAASGLAGGGVIIGGTGGYFAGQAGGGGEG